MRRSHLASHIPVRGRNWEYGDDDTNVLVFGDNDDGQLGVIANRAARGLGRHPDGRFALLAGFLRRPGQRGAKRVLGTARACDCFSRSDARSSHQSEPHERRVVALDVALPQKLVLAEALVRHLRSPVGAPSSGIIYAPYFEKCLLKLASKERAFLAPCAAELYK